MSDTKYHDAVTPGDFLSVDAHWDDDLGLLGLVVEQDGTRAIVVLSRLEVERLRNRLDYLLEKDRSMPDARGSQHD